MAQQGDISSLVASSCFQGNRFAQSIEGRAGFPVFRWITFVVLLVVCSMVAAQESGEQIAVAPSNSDPFQLADVIIDGRLVMKVRGTASFPATRRAAEIEQNIIEVARDETIPAEAVTLKEEGDRTLLLAGNRLLLDMFDTDAEIEGVSRQLLAEVRQERLQEVIASYRTDRMPRVLLMKSAYALGAVLVTVGLIFGFRKSFRGLGRLLDRLLKARIKNLEAKSARLIRSQQLFKLLHGLLKAAHFLLVALTLYLSLNFILGLYPWTRGFATWLFGLVLTPLREMGKGFVATIPDLVWLVVLYFVTRYILGMIKAFFQNISDGAIKLTSFDRDWSWPTYRLLRIAVIIFAVVMAYPHIPGSGSEAFKGIGVLLGLMISLGSTSIIGNIIAGYSLTYRSPFKIGDRIKINDIVGEVTDIKVLTTRLRSMKNEEVVIPNTTVLNGAVTNYSTLAKQEGLLLHTSVGIGYETPWRQVEAMLKQAANQTSGLLKKPKPFVLQTELGDYAVNYEINAYCADARNLPHIYAALHRNIQDIFNEYGVAIMTPSYMADPDEPKVVPKDLWYAPPAKPPADAE
jgi:small-conductance mechanosensitive channel